MSDKKPTQQTRSHNGDRQTGSIADMLNADSDFYEEDQNDEAESPDLILKDEPIPSLAEGALPDQQENHLPEEHQRSFQEQQIKIAGLEEALRKEKADFLRARAEVENIRRRAVEDVQKAHKFGNEKLIKELLDVLESLERALNEAGEQASDLSGVNTVTEGVRLTLDLLLSILGKFGVEVIDPTGQPFDPQLHEAMSMQPGTEYPAGVVIMSIQKGYTLHGRLVRPARVVIAK